MWVGGIDLPKVSLARLGVDSDRSTGRGRWRTVSAARTSVREVGIMRAKATERSLVGRPDREVQLFVEGEGEARKVSRGRPRIPLTHRVGKVPQGPLEASREGHGAVGKANDPRLLGGIG